MKNPRTVSMILSFLSGYVDTAVFVYMGGLFVAHVTGNFVLFGASITGQPLLEEHGQTKTLQLLSLPVFIAAAALAAIIAGRLERPNAGTRAILAIAAILFAGVGLAALAGWDMRVSGSILLIVAMGMLNAVHRLDVALGPPFTVMTGNVTGLAIACARKLRLAPPTGSETSAIAMTGPPVAGFLLGCAAGALAQAHLGLGAMVIPTILIGAALIVAV